MILAAILFGGILTMWVPARWALSAFHVALFAFAILRIARRIRSERPLGWHPVALLLVAAVLWGPLQIAAHRSVYEWRTWQASLDWLANLAAFSLALELAGSRREWFLRATLLFAFLLSIVAAFTVFTSPIGKVFWWFSADAPVPSLGPFVYRNQYAAFIEAILPFAIVQSIRGRRRSIVYLGMAAAMFASVVAGGSRTGSILCLAEILAVPMIAFWRKLIPGRVLIRALGASIAAIAIFTAVVGWQSIWNRLQEPNPYSLRAELVRSSLEMIRDRPIAGFGLGTWSDVYPAYARFDDGRFVNQAHNDWVQWAAEGGIPFFLILVAIALWTVRPALRSLWGIGMLVVFVHCLVDYPMQQRPALAAFFFAMLGLVTANENPNSARLFARKRNSSA
ncbi:MAG: O-antigen ligase family protein [Bryobacteraceae bacterium]